MKIKILWVLLVSGCSVTAAMAETTAKMKADHFSCSNRVVRIVLPTVQVDALKMKFEVINSLPYDLKSSRLDDRRSEVLVSYRTLVTGDLYSTPTNPQFFKQVGGVLSGSEKTLQIEKMSAEYLPNDRC